MPNWTTNAIACHEDDLRRILDDEGRVDFNRIVPRPEGLDVTSGSVERVALAYAAAAAKGDERGMHEALERLPQFFQQGDGPAQRIETAEDLARVAGIYADNIRKYGASTWYNWCIENWGTKWNACETHTIDLGGGWDLVTFDTAWDAPSPEFVEKLFNGFQHAFQMESFDEDYHGITQNASCIGGAPNFERVLLEGDGELFSECELSDGDYVYETAQITEPPTAFLDELDAGYRAHIGGDTPGGIDLEAEDRDARDASASLSDGASLDEEARDAPEHLNNTDR